MATARVTAGACGAGLSAGVVEERGGMVGRYRTVLALRLAGFPSGGGSTGDERVDRRRIHAGFGQHGARVFAGRRRD